MLVLTLGDGVRYVRVDGPDGRPVATLARTDLPAEGEETPIRDGGRVVGVVRGLAPSLFRDPPDGRGPRLVARVGIDLPRRYRIERNNLRARPAGKGVPS